MDPMMASIMMFGGTFAPRQWAFCQGQLLAISSNTALFSLLGTTWGGDGRTTFALPNMSSRGPIGTGQGPGLRLRREGQTGGQESVTLTQLEMPVHSHSANFQPGGGGLEVSTANASRKVPQAGDYLATVNDGASGLNPTQYPAYVPAGSQGTTVQAAGVAAGGQITVGNAGGGQSHQNMQPFLVVPFIIAVQGIFPSRN